MGQTDHGRRDKTIRAEVTEGEKGQWEQYLARLPGIETTHREGMLRAALALERMADRHTSLVDEVWAEEVESTDGPFG